MSFGNKKLLTSALSTKRFISNSFMLLSASATAEISNLTTNYAINRLTIVILTVFCFSLSRVSVSDRTHMLCLFSCSDISNSKILS